jgi:hypothetical protein
MPAVSKPRPHTVIYDADAVVEFVTAVKSKEERRAIFNAVEKLRELGERLAPPHMKPLQGEAAGGLCELRPRQGRSDWRALYRRFGSTYVVLAVDRHDNFAALVARAQQRAVQYAGPPLELR